MIRGLLVLAAVVGSIISPVAWAGDWPEFRGPWGNGNAAAPGVYYVHFVSGPRRFTKQVVLLP